MKQQIHKGFIMRESTKDLLMALAMAAIAVTALLSLYTTERPPTSFQYASGLQFSTLPGLYAGLLLALCVVQLAITGLTKRRDTTDRTVISFNRPLLGKVAATVALLLAFVLLMGKVPFALLCAGFLCLLFLLYGKRNLPQVLGIGVAGALSLHLLFVLGLGLRL